MDLSFLKFLPLKLNIHGVSVDFGPIVGKLFDEEKDGLKAGDLASLIPVALALGAAYLNKSHDAPAVAPPAPPFMPPVATPAPAPPVAAGDPLASLKINTIWKKKQGVPTNEPGQVNLATLAWGDKVALDVNGADAKGEVRKDLVHGPVHYFVRWDGKDVEEVWGENGVQMHKGDLEQINVGGKEYFETDGGVAVVKVFKEGVADANRHQIEFWASAQSALGLIKTNVLTGFVN